jgi:hypothetical protein
VIVVLVSVDSVLYTIRVFDCFVLLCVVDNLDLLIQFMMFFVFEGSFVVSKAVFSFC